MKELLHSIIYRLVRVNWIWFLISPFTKSFSWFQFHRNKELEKRRGPLRDETLERICKDAVVKSGPFKGMRYPDFTAHGSAIFPKIIGCYEKEIEPAIENVCSKVYTEIIDVGCAEGYYAVGLAMRLKDATVYAYDIDEEAGNYCRKLAILNGVGDRIIVRGEIKAADLAVFPFSRRGLVVCDCEGFEKHLFTTDNIANLSNCDLIIEFHDFIDIHISDYICNLFRQSHHIHMYQSVDDIIKARNYNYPELTDLDLSLRKKLVAEGRPALMEWVYLEAKSYTL